MSRVAVWRGLEFLGFFGLFGLLGLLGMGKPPFRREERFKNVRLQGEMLTDARRGERRRLTE